MKTIVIIFLLLLQNIFSQSNFLPLPEDAEVLIEVDMNNAKDKNGISFSTIDNVVFAFQSSNPIFCSSDSTSYAKSLQHTWTRSGRIGKRS